MDFTSYNPWHHKNNFENMAKPLHIKSKFGHRGIESFSGTYLLIPARQFQQDNAWFIMPWLQIKWVWVLDWPSWHLTFKATQQIKLMDTTFVKDKYPMETVTNTYNSPVTFLGDFPWSEPKILNVTGYSSQRRIRELGTLALKQYVDGMGNYCTFTPHSNHWQLSPPLLL